MQREEGVRSMLPQSSCRYRLVGSRAGEEGYVGEVTWQLNHHGSLEIEVSHRDLSPNAAPASGW